MYYNADKSESLYINGRGMNFVVALGELFTPSTYWVLEGDVGSGLHYLVEYKGKFYDEGGEYSSLKDFNETYKKVIKEDIPMLQQGIIEMMQELFLL